MYVFPTVLLTCPKCVSNAHVMPGSQSLVHQPSSTPAKICSSSRMLDFSSSKQLDNTVMGVNHLMAMLGQR